MASDFERYSQTALFCVGHVTDFALAPLRTSSCLLVKLMPVSSSTTTVNFGAGESHSGGRGDDDDDDVDVRRAEPLVTLENACPVRAWCDASSELRTTAPQVAHRRGSGLIGNLRICSDPRESHG